MATKILFVDDEPDQARLMQRMFRRRIRAGEFAFLFAADGEEALAVLEDEPEVDVVVSDINMPRMDGLTLLERLQDHDRLLKAVVVSAYGDMKNIRAAMNKGAFDFVTKPVEFEDLDATISKSLQALAEIRENLHRLAEAERIRANLTRFFSPNLAYQLVNHPEELAVGGERRELTFVFTDITDFTPLVEASEPALVVALLNEYLDEMTSIVFDYAGTVDKVVGDAVNALFGAPQEQVDHARRAVECALEMDAFAREFAERKRAEGIPFGDTRFGINTGSAIVGNFGGETLFNYTAYGDAVNIAARLEAANKALGTRICVSSETSSQIPGFLGRPVASLLVKGKSQAVDVYEPFATGKEPDYCEAYRAAYRLASAGDPAAKSAFTTLAAQYPEDAVIALHLARLRAGRTEPVLDLREEKT